MLDIMVANMDAVSAMPKRLRLLGVSGFHLMGPGTRGTEWDSAPLDAERSAEGPNDASSIRDRPSIGLYETWKTGSM
jgi:hypothetical protein